MNYYNLFCSLKINLDTNCTNSHELPRHVFNSCQSVKFVSHISPSCSRAASVKPSRNCPRSRGEPRPATTRPSARPTSGSARNTPRMSPRSSGSSCSQLTSSSRRVIARALGLDPLPRQAASFDRWETADPARLGTLPRVFPAR